MQDAYVLGKHSLYSRRIQIPASIFPSVRHPQNPIFRECDRGSSKNDR